MLALTSEKRGKPHVKFSELFLIHSLNYGEVEGKFNEIKNHKK